MRTIAAVVTGDELRAVMRRVPAGIAVVTLEAGGQRVGVTVGSLVSLSLEPPLVAWERVETRAGETGAPLLADATGWLECRLRGEHDAGDHTFFVADVLAAVPGRVPSGLVYVDGTYRDV